MQQESTFHIVVRNRLLKPICELYDFSCHLQKSTLLSLFELDMSEGIGYRTSLVAIPHLK